MNSFVYEYPIKVYFGEGCVKQHLEKRLKNYGKTVLLAYGGGSVKRNGIYEQITAVLLLTAVKSWRRRPGANRTFGKWSFPTTVILMSGFLWGPLLPLPAPERK